MKFSFSDEGLNTLYYEGRGKEKYSTSVVDAFFKKIQKIDAAKNENDLRAMKGNHFEKLEGGNNKYSIRLNKQYRLIFCLERDGSCTVLVIEEISNHYS